MLTFEKLTPGDNLGTNTQYFDDDVAADWLEMFPVHRFPKLGDEIITTTLCKKKEIWKNNNWVYFETQSHDQNGELLFTGSMGIIWGG